MALDGLSVVLVVHGVADVLGHKIDRRRKFLIFARAYQGAHARKFFTLKNLLNQAAFSGLGFVCILHCKVPFGTPVFVCFLSLTL